MWTTAEESGAPTARYHRCNSLLERSVQKGNCIPKHLAESHGRHINVKLGSNGQSSAAGPSLCFAFSGSSHFSSVARPCAPRSQVCPLQLHPSLEETSIPVRRRQCRRRSAVRSRGKWPRRMRNSPWRWSSHTEEPRQSSETVADRNKNDIVSTALNQSPWQPLQSLYPC